MTTGEHHRREPFPDPVAIERALRVFVRPDRVVDDEEVRGLAGAGTADTDKGGLAALVGDQQARRTLVEFVLREDRPVKIAFDDRADFGAEFVGKGLVVCAEHDVAQRVAAGGPCRKASADDIGLAKLRPDGDGHALVARLAALDLLHDVTKKKGLGRGDVSGRAGDAWPVRIGHAQLIVAQQVRRRLLAGQDVLQLLDLAIFGCFGHASAQAQMVVVKLPPGTVIHQDGLGPPDRPRCIVERQNGRPAGPVSDDNRGIDGVVEMEP